MRLPTQVIGRIFFTAGTSATVQLLRAGAADGSDSALFMSAVRAAYVGKYWALGFAAAHTIDTEKFFDLLGQPTQRSDALQKIRHIEGIDIAQHYEKASKGPVHAYWIQGAPGTFQYLHFVVDGSDTIYSVVGGITPELRRAILSNLAIRPEP